MRLDEYHDFPLTPSQSIWTGLALSVIAGCDFAARPQLHMMRFRGNDEPGIREAIARYHRTKRA